MLIKAAGGGGGRGMKVARDESELRQLLPLAQSEAKAYFGNDAVYLERYLAHPRHIEIQIMADGQGHAIHLGERDCSLQRSHQKLLEETPSPALNAEQRRRLGDIATKAMRKLNYRGAGTIEFLYEDGEFFFIEMNTRLQVEHPITEMISGIDIVREQIRIASGAPLSWSQDEVKLSRPRHRVPHQRRASGDLHPVARPHHRLPCAGRPRRAHRQRALSGLQGAAQLRQPGLEADRSRHQPQRVPSCGCGAPSRNTSSPGSRPPSRSISASMLAPDFINGAYDIHWLEKFVGRGETS